MARKKIGSGWRSTVDERLGSRKRFEQLVADALDALPEQIRARMENVEVIIEDGPLGSTLGLYTGIPQTERDAGYAGVLPDLITIYRAPIEAKASNAEELAEEIRRTVWHEVAHHFGISDDRLDELDRY
ncbi:MAG TPA: metallopeptidase family protein [Actinomycetota bacterium]|nr:metallopeptidase family protein [Actinomycetota bacterium]